MTKQEYAEMFEKLVGKRFKTLAELEEYVEYKTKSNKKVRFDFSYINYEEDFLADWDLCTYIENDEVSCDLDVYFLYDRYQYVYITEVGYEINMVED
jgi:hypothetical protein